MMIEQLLLLAAEEEEDHNVLLPAGADLFWGSVSFVILLVMFWKWVLPRMQEVLDQRTAGIENKLEQAERDRAEAEALLAQYRDQLAAARQEAARIRAEAQAERQSIVDEARNEARLAAEQVTERAHAQMEADLAQAKARLSRDVGELSVVLAEKIVGEALRDAQAVRSTVDRFLVDLEEQAAPDTARTP